MNPNAFRTANFICAAPETGDGMEFWVDWVPAIDGVPGRALHGKITENELWVAPLDSSDISSSAGRLITPLNDEVMDAIQSQQDPEIFVVLCGPSGVISRTFVQIIR